MDTNVPQTINNYPVVAYIGAQGYANSSGVVAVYRDDRINNDRNYVTWRVTRVPGTEVWHAEGGVYDLSYHEALSSLAYRAGINSK